MSGKIFILVACALAWGSIAFAQAPSFPEESSWMPIQRSGVSLEDEEGDAMGYRDAVGDASFPAAYYAYDAFYFYFRLRLDKSPLKNPSVFQKFAWGAACNVEGTTNSYQILVLLDGFADPDRVTLQKNLVQQVDDSPADVSEMLAASYPASTHARSQSAPSNFGGDADFFVDWAASDLSLPPFGLEAGATGRCVLGTSGNRFSLQRDIVSPSGTETLSASYSDLYGCLEPLICVDMEYGDEDEDGAVNGADNCPLAANPGQEDLDGDGWGDACDVDNDGDGVPDASDNCPLSPNSEQTDTDADGEGDACDGDDDGDGVLDGADNCPLIVNPCQEDVNGNGLGDLSEGDSDGDGIVDGADNCPLDSNAGQHDLDVDWIGDVCDIDDDGDGVFDGEDNCPFADSADQVDTDADGWGDPCDGDDDGDEIADGDDNCPLTANPDQTDRDGNAVGDACEGDADGDGIHDAQDNCPLIFNPTQSDVNGNGAGDLCDATTSLSFGGGGGCGLMPPGVPGRPLR